MAELDDKIAEQVVKIRNSRSRIAENDVQIALRGLRLLYLIYKSFRWLKKSSISGNFVRNSVGLQPDNVK